MGYDALGRQIRTVYPSAPGMAGPFTVDQLYNERGYATQVRDVTVPSAPAVLWTVNAADAEDHLLTETLGNGLTVNSEYFPDTGLLKHRLTPNVYDMQYEYDPNGNLRSRTDRFNSGWPGLQKVDTETFSYDGANRLKQVTLSNPSGVVSTFTYGYDVLGNVIQASDAPQCTDSWRAQRNDGQATAGFLQFTWSSMNAGEIRYTWKLDLSRLAVPAAAAAGVGAAAWGWRVLRGLGTFIDKTAGATMFMLFILPQQHGDPA